MTCDSVVPLLDRYLDRELPDADRTRVEAHLGGCASCAVEALRREELRVAIRDAGRAFEPDAAMRARFQARLRDGAGRRSVSWLLPLAAVLLVGLALGTFWTWARVASRDRVVGQIVDLHVATLGQAAPLDVLSSDQHTVKPWFEGKVPFSFEVPDLAGSGWELVGGRLVKVDGAPAAQLVLRIRLHRATVLVLEDSAGLARGLSDLDDRGKSRGFRLVSWTANGLRYVAVSGTGAQDVRALADRFLRAARS